MSEMLGENFFSGVLSKEEWHTRLEYIVELANSAPSSQPLPVSVLFFDVDRFKDINDVYGHDMGDIVIEDIKNIVGLVSSQLRNQSRDTDQDEAFGDFIGIDAGHIGGDEFGVAVQADLVGATAIRERFMAAFDNYLERPENTRLRELQVGLSIGVASLQPGMSSAELCRQADQDMYAVKRERFFSSVTDEDLAAAEAAMRALRGSRFRLRDLLRVEEFLQHREQLD